MSRSGYSDDCENLGLWRGAVRRAIHGKRGQAFLKELATAMDAMPEKRLIAHEFASADGEVCAIGTVARVRAMDLDKLNGLASDYDHEAIAKMMGIAPAMVQEIEFMNDDEYGFGGRSPEARWTRMRAWVEKMLNGGDPG